MKSWLEQKAIEMCSKHHFPSVIAERFIRTLKNEIYKYMTSILKLHKLIHYMTYIEFNKENEKEAPKLRTSKHKKTFTKGYVPNWSEKNFVIKRVKINVPWTYAVSDFNGGETVWTFYAKELQTKKIQKNLELKK